MDGAFYSYAFSSTTLGSEKGQVNGEKSYYYCKISIMTMDLR